MRSITSNGMKIHRFIGEFKLKTGHIIISDAEIFNQMKNVLRLEAGETIILGDGKLNEGEAKIISFGKGSVEVEIMEVGKNTNEPSTDVILYCSILKKENFEWVVQKATELGIKEIVPVISKRTVKLNLRADRLEKIIREAAEQSGRGIVPKIHEPINFEDAVRDISKDGGNLFFDISGVVISILKPNTYNLKPVSVWVGPEGGWDDTEIELARANKFTVVSLGKLTLRAETAAIVASGLVLSALSTADSK